MVEIYLATESDVEVLYQLTKALAEFEKKAPEEIFVTAEKLRKWGFGKHKFFQALVARVDLIPVGMALFYYGYSGYMGSPILYLEDLFVLPEHRNRGIGRAILQDLGVRALEAECCRMQWAVFDWNVDAIKFYESISGQLRPDLVQVRLDEPGIKQFVGTSQASE